MSYRIYVKRKHIDHIFGVAYPRMNLTRIQKMKIIECMLSDEFSLDRSYSNRQIDVDTEDTQYRIRIDLDNETAQYQKSISIEKYINDIESRKAFKIRRLFNFWFRFKVKPKNIFLISDEQTVQVMYWILRNIRPTHYQFYSKFESDTSISFKTEEDALMYKLAFGN